MTRSARCGLCGADVIYNPETFAWRHNPRIEDDHAPVPIDIVYPTKTTITTKKGRKRNG
jgi:hypothetical protein